MAEEAMETRMTEAIKTKNTRKMVDIFLELNGEAGTPQYAFNQPMLDMYVNEGEPGADGNIVSAVLFNPGPPPQAGAAAAAITLFTLHKKECDNHGGRLSRFRTLLIKCLDVGDQAIFGGARLSTMALRNMFAILDTEFRERNPRREAELDKIILEKIKTEETFIQFAAKKHDAWRELEEVHNIVTTEGDKVKALIKGITDENGEWVDGRGIVQEIWESNNPTNLTRTVARLTATLKIHDGAKPRERKAGEEFAGAAKASGKEETFCVTKLEMRRIIEEENRARGGKNNGGAGGGGGQYKGGGGQHKGGGGAGRITPGPPGTLKTFLCSTHGWNWYHMSRMCKRKHRDHRDDETEAERRIRLPGDLNNDRI